MPKFTTKELVEFNGQSGGIVQIWWYSTNKRISFKTSMLRSDLCHFSDLIFLLKEKLRFIKEQVQIEI